MKRRSKPKNDKLAAGDIKLCERALPRVTYVQNALLNECNIDQRYLESNSSNLVAKLAGQRSGTFTKAAKSQ